MFVYFEVGHGKWSVGHYDASGKWSQESEQLSRTQAYQRVLMLNARMALARHTGYSQSNEVVDKNRMVTPDLYGRNGLTRTNEIH